MEVKALVGAVCAVAGLAAGVVIGQQLSKQGVNKGEPNSVWNGLTHPPDTPDGFTARGAVSEESPEGVEVFMEQWEAGSAEPPHSHPGDDMTTVVEGKMSIQFFTRVDGKLVPDGKRITLSAGQSGYIQANRIHDAKYIEKCRLVYVHDKAFGFKDESAVTTGKK